MEIIIINVSFNEYDCGCAYIFARVTGPIVGIYIII
jgi:hypothetical protein